MVWIKICGLTNREDAEAAAALGTDALGFIFAAGKRQAERERVKEIIALLPEKVEKIGVFLDQDRDYVRETLTYCRLTGVQLHGSESPRYCRQFRDFTVIKAFRVDEKRGWDDIRQYVEEEAVHRILLDTYVAGLAGGTGQTFPWSLIKSRHTWSDIPLIIAGGITPANVSRAIATGEPFGIDVGSGVELEPGKKDRKKMRQLIIQARAIEGQGEIGRGNGE
ncbi:MAG: phosphoribosylanthranilate isomerase [Peptococcaceae bacterium]